MEHYCGQEKKIDTGYNIGSLSRLEAMWVLSWVGRWISGTKNQSDCNKQLVVTLIVTVKGSLAIPQVNKYLHMSDLQSFKLAIHIYWIFSRNPNHDKNQPVKPGEDSYMF